MADFLATSTFDDITKLYTGDAATVIDKFTRFYGWIRRVRVGGGGKLVFIDIYDGTRVGELKCIVSAETYTATCFELPELTDYKIFETLEFEQLEKASHLSDGCAVVVDGKVVASPTGATQQFEFQIHCLRVIGRAGDALYYPIKKSVEEQLVALRQLPFMRIRAQVMQSIFRIGSELEYAIATFMRDEHVVKTDPNILTVSDCEGAGETFSISPCIFSKDATGNDLKVGLTVSSQLPLESSICGFRQVYTVQKSFRAEKSDTSKHLAEFLHVEYEGAFHTLDTLMNFTEKFVKFVIQFVLTSCKQDFDYLESKHKPVDLKPARNMLVKLLDKPFVRIKHADAVDLINKLVETRYMLPDDNGKMKRVQVEKLPQKDQDVSSEHEKLLVRYFGWIAYSEEERLEKLKSGWEFSSFVFLTHWPLAIKSFYMKQCDDGSGESESFDLLAPRVGELFGGSMREWRHDKLLSEIEKRKMDITPIQWFVDLRKSGSMPHGGWGMGFARLVTLLTGVPSIRDAVYLPVYYKYCPY